VTFRKILTGNASNKTNGELQAKNGIYGLNPEFSIEEKYKI
jgi:hypothetical protein